MGKTNTIYLLLLVSLSAMLAGGLGCATTSTGAQPVASSEEADQGQPPAEGTAPGPESASQEKPASALPEGFVELKPGPAYNGKMYYKGPLSAEGWPEGRGEINYDNGYRYEGEFKLGFRFGQGTLTAPDGTTWSGTWTPDGLEGYGMTQGTDGYEYEGQWKSGLRNGIGTSSYKGLVYKGEWKDGKQSGRGVESFNDEGRLEGTWENGRCISGTRTYSDGATYVGGLKDLRYQGAGALTLPSGLKIEGEWTESKIYNGTMTYPNGDTYKGGIVQHTPDPNPENVVYYLQQGQGTMNYVNGNVYVGEWSLGQRHGFGKMTTKDGKAYEGMWRKDEFYGASIGADTAPGTSGAPQNSAPVPVTGPTYSPAGAMETKVDGDFEGWEGETIVKLMNGQIWQQAEYYYRYHYAFMPAVIVYQSEGSYKMKVDGVDKAVRVKQLK